MKIYFYIIFVILVLLRESWQKDVAEDTEKKRGKRDTGQTAQTNADVMVQNILQWLQGVYTQNSRKIRQGSFREYLPPSNTQKPRPFEPQQPGHYLPPYPPSGSITPQPPFTIYTNPATGGVTGEGGSPSTEPTGEPVSTYPTQPTRFPTRPRPTGYPTRPTPGYETGPSSVYTTSYPTRPTGGYPTGPTTGYPTRPTGYPTRPRPTGYPTRPTGYPTGPTGFPTRPTGYPTGPTTGFPTRPTGYPTQPTDEFPTRPTGFPTRPTGFPTRPTGYPTRPTGYPTGTTEYPTRPTGYPTGPTTRFPTRPTSYPTGTTEYPTRPSGYPTGSTTSRYPGFPTAYPTRPTGQEDTEPTYRPGYSTTSGYRPTTQQPTRYPTVGPTYRPTGEPTYRPTSTPNPDDNSVIPTQTSISPDATGRPTPPDDDLRHPPHIHDIQVQCAKDMMQITIEFNRQFDGVIYSKGFYGNPECRYVTENTGQIKYTFTVSLNSCGTEFVTAFDTLGQSYLENVLVIQNEAGVQEVWDTIRAVRCLWEGNLKETLSVNFNVGMLTQEIVTFSGDTAMARLDIQLGRGPFAPPANGLVKIGEMMTLVISVTGDAGFDIQVKQCRAKDVSGENSILLTDEDGCVLKHKLFGAFQKTRDTGNTGANIIAYAFFNAFKFPDMMDLVLECNIELCKTDCEVCPNPNEPLEPVRRRRRSIYTNESLGDPVTMGKRLSIILPEDLSSGEAIINLNETYDSICLSMQSFILSSILFLSLFSMSCLTSAYLWLKNQQFHLKQ